MTTNRRNAIRTALLTTGGIFTVKTALQPQAQASAGIVGGCAIVILAVTAGALVRMFVKRCEVIYKFACNPRIGMPHCNGATAQWWKNHPEIKTLPPDFKLAEACDQYWSTNSPPPNWCPPPQLGNKRNPAYSNPISISETKPVSVGEAVYDDGEDGLLPQQVMLIRCNNGHPELIESWSDFGGWIPIPDRYATEPVQIAEFQAEGSKMLIRVRFA